MSASPRRVVPEASSRRGWCPSLARPMPTGDGLLARVHPRLGMLSVAQIRAIADAARRFGNGHVDVTARGNLQIRGVTDETAPALAVMLAAAGLGDVRTDGGPQRLTLTSPLAGLDRSESVDVPALARAIEAAGLGIPGLPAKTLVAIESAGLARTDADIVLRPARGGGVSVVLAAEDDAAAEWIAASEAEAVAAVSTVLHAFAASGRRRVRDLSMDERAEILFGFGRETAPHAPPLPRHTEDGVVAIRSPRDGRRDMAAALPPLADPSLPAGLEALGDGRVAIAVEAPFGRCDADALDRLVGIALELSVGRVEEPRDSTRPDPASGTGPAMSSPRPHPECLADKPVSYPEPHPEVLRSSLEGGFQPAYDPWNPPSRPASWPPQDEGEKTTKTFRPDARDEAEIGMLAYRTAAGTERDGAASAVPEIRTSPTRGFVLVCADRESAAEALSRLEAAGFITAPDDPRRAVAACPGAPACASGSTLTLRDAARLAEAFAPLAAAGLTAHVSGCAKGCAHPAAADLTLVGAQGRYGIVLRGTPGALPARHLTFEAALERVRRAASTLSLDDAFRTTP